MIRTDSTFNTNIHPLFAVPDIGALVGAYLNSSLLTKVWSYEKKDALCAMLARVNAISLKQLHAICKNHEIEKIEDILQFLPNLTSLTLAYDGKIGDTELKQIASKVKQFCPLIRIADLRHNCFTDKGLSLFLESVPKLTDLNLMGTPVSDEGLKNVAKSYSNLLSIAFPPQVTIKGLEAFYTYCPNITSCDFTSCKKMGMTELRFLSSFTALTSLDFTCCTQIEDRWLASISHPNLTSLNFSGCTQLSSNAIRAIKKALTKLSNLVFPNDGSSVLSRSMSNLSVSDSNNVGFSSNY